MIAPRIRWRASITSSVFPSLVWAVMLGVISASSPLPRSVFAKTKPNRQSERTGMPPPAHADNDGYVGSAACAQCHASISANFARTQMGRSLTPVSPGALAKFPLPSYFDSERLNRHFDVFTQNGKLYQSESEMGPGGEDIFRNPQEVKWIVGAG